MGGAAGKLSQDRGALSVAGPRLPAPRRGPAHGGPQAGGGDLAGGALAEGSLLPWFLWLPWKHGCLDAGTLLVPALRTWVTLASDSAAQRLTFLS